MKCGGPPRSAPGRRRRSFETLTGAQLTEALLNGFSPVCNSAIATGRFPQVSGLAIDFRCDGATPVVVSVALAPDGPGGGTLTPIEPADTVRIVTNDFMFGGGDGYTALAGGTNVLQPGDALLDVVIEYIGELAGGAGGGRADREGLSRRSGPSRTRSGRSS